MHRGLLVLVLWLLQATLFTGCIGGLNLEPATTGPVTGKVAQYDGSPIDGATVILNGERVVTDLQGVFTVNAVILPNGAQIPFVPLSVSKDQFRAELREVELNVFSATNIGEVELLAAPNTGTVAGRVTAQDTGSSLRNALVQVIMDGSFQIKGQTASDGSYLLTGIPFGDWVVKTSADGFLTKELPWTVLQGNNPDLLINLLQVGAAIDVLGIVLNADDQEPIDGAQVSAGGVVATTDILGSFTLQNVPSGLQTVTVNHSQFEAWQDELNLTGEMVTLFLSPPGSVPGTPFSVSGTVMLQGSSNFADVQVTAIDPTTDEQLDTDFTDNAGYYKLFLPPGTYELRAVKSGFQDETKIVTLPAGGVIMTVDFTLVP